jgi:GH24 family phage-related lysozyme (muramidase)
MGQVAYKDNASQSPSSVGGFTVRRRIAMESMTAEELRLNKQLLQEISQRKREKQSAIVSPRNEYTLQEDL